MAGSGYVKSENPALEIENNCAFAALMAAREAQDAAFNKAWISEEEESEVLDVSEAPVLTTTEPTLPLPVTSVSPSDTCFQVDGHFYKVPDAERIGTIEAALIELAAARAKEEASWAAHWTSAPETKTETNTLEELPQLEVSDL
jgi:hypothetical protein